MNSINLDRQALLLLILKSAFSSTNGLFYGKTGILIFFYKFSHQTIFTIPLNNLIDILISDIYNNLNNKMNHNLSDGLAGIGWGLEYLIQHDFFKADCDFLHEIDHIIMEKSLLRINDFSIEDGLEGYLHYISIRIRGFNLKKSTHAFTLDYISEIQTLLSTNNKFKSKANYLFHFDNLKNFVYNPNILIKYIINYEHIINYENIQSYPLGLHDGLSGHLLKKIIY